MITALVSTVLGMVGGVLPDVVKEIKDTRQHQREIEFIERQAEAQVKVAQFAHDSRMREIEMNQFVEETRASMQALGEIIKAQAQPTGILWIDGLNAALRPTIVVMVMILFLAVAYPYSWAIMAEFQAGKLTSDQMMQAIYGSMIGEAIQATLAFLFGYRSSAKRPA